MNSELYSVAAMIGRYIFVALIVYITLSAGILTLLENRQASRKRHTSSQHGRIGELVVRKGDEQVKQDTRYLLFLEGMIGSSRHADIRIRHSSVQRRHAYFHLTKDGIYMRAYGNAHLGKRRNISEKELTLKNGSSFYIGELQLSLSLTSANKKHPRINTKKKRPAQTSPDDLFNVTSNATSSPKPKKSSLRESKSEKENSPLNQSTPTTKDNDLRRSKRVSKDDADEILYGIVEDRIPPKKKRWWESL